MKPSRITVIKGDGIGPSIVEAVIRILDETDCGFTYDYMEAGLAAMEQSGELLPQYTLDAMVVEVERQPPDPKRFCGTLPQVIEKLPA